MITVVGFGEIPRHAQAVFEMHRLRHRVFKERLGWEVTSSGGLEVDEYDAAKPVYLLYHEHEDGPVLGCVRLLPTTGPYMLADTFPLLLGGRPAPRGFHAWEASRFALDGDAGRVQGRKVARGTAELVAAVHEFALAKGLSEIVAVVDVRMERILRLAGWSIERYRQPVQVGVTMALAGSLPVSEEGLDRIRRTNGIDGVLGIEPAERKVAA